MLRKMLLLSQVGFTYFMTDLLGRPRLAGQAARARGEQETRKGSNL